MFCKKCRTNNPPVAKFCENCGVKLHNARKETTTVKQNDVPLSLVIAVVVVILFVAAIFTVLSLI